MEEFQGGLLGWSWEENKRFEIALAVVDQKDPQRWSKVAAMVGGRNAKEVEKHYENLVEDLLFIESGEMDHRLEEVQLCHLSGDSKKSASWTDENQELLLRLKI